MKYRLWLTSFLCAVGATPVIAQSQQSGFYVDGYAEFSFSDGFAGNNRTLGYSEATIGYNSQSGFGLEFGVDGLITRQDDEAALYGALTFQSSFGKVSLGAPRAALDTYLDHVPTVAGLVDLKLGEPGLAKRSVLTTAYLFDSGEVPLGLRYDGSFGSTNVGASYHRYDDTNVYDVAANYQLGDTTLTGALEHTVDDGDSETRVFLGVDGKLGPVTAGLLYSGNYAFGSDAAIEAYATYKPMDELALTASALNFDAGSGSNTLYGLSADYTFGSNAYVQAGVADDFDSGSGTAYNLALGLRF